MLQPDSQGNDDKIIYREDLSNIQLSQALLFTQVSNAPEFLGACLCKNSLRYREALNRMNFWESRSRMRLLTKLALFLGKSILFLNNQLKIRELFQLNTVLKPSF